MPSGSGRDLTALTTGKLEAGSLQRTSASLHARSFAMDRAFRSFKNLLTYYNVHSSMTLVLHNLLWAQGVSNLARALQGFTALERKSPGSLFLLVPACLAQHPGATRDVALRFTSRTLR